MRHMSAPAILDVWQYIEPRYGGVGPAAAALASSIRAASNWSFQQAALCRPEESRFADGIDPQTLVVKIAGRRPWVDHKLRLELTDLVRSCDLCHVHGIWQPQSLAVQSLAVQLHKPIIASAHGMLEKWELANKTWRKTLYAALFERPSLSRSTCLRALSIEEANDYRRFGLTRPIAIVPNGVGRLSRVSPSMLTERFPHITGKDVVLYLSRIHQKKGILNLLAGWQRVVAEHKQAHLLVAGPEYPRTAAAARAIVSQCGISSSVTFAGTLAGHDKLAALSLARCFCLPSYSEGQSIAVLEALSIGLPVVITAACNVDGVVDARAGLVCSNTPTDLSDSLLAILKLSSSSWQRMSESAQRLAYSRFDWSQIGRRMLTVYEWMLGGSKPDYVTG